LFVGAWSPLLSQCWTRLTASAISLGYWKKEVSAQERRYTWWLVAEYICEYLEKAMSQNARQKSHLYRGTIEVPLWTRAGWPTSLQYDFKCDMNLLDVFGIQVFEIGWPIKYFGSQEVLLSEYSFRILSFFSF